MERFVRRGSLHSSYAEEAIDDVPHILFIGQAETCFLGECHDGPKMGCEILEESHTGGGLQFFTP